MNRLVQLRRASSRPAGRHAKHASPASDPRRIGLQARRNELTWTWQNPVLLPKGTDSHGRYTYVWSRFPLPGCPLVDAGGQLTKPHHIMINFASVAPPFDLRFSDALTAVSSLTTHTACTTSRFVPDRSNEGPDEVTHRAPSRGQLAQPVHARRLGQRLFCFESPSPTAEFG